MPETTTTTTSSTSTTTTSSTSTTSTTTSTTTTAYHSSCDACYNGCVSVTPDACVRYTGLDSIPLDIQTGDNLKLVLTNIIDNLVPLLTGEGDKVLLIDAIRCALINTYLPSPTIPSIWTSAQIFEALVKSVCELQSEIDIGVGLIFDIEAPYTTDCLTVVPGNSITHQTLQATIDKLCLVSANLDAFEIYADVTYVKLADLNALIAAYLSSQLPSTQQYVKMIPYAVIEYYGPLTNFDGTGAGISALGWDKVYLCNGSNGTPDKRGRVGVGAIFDVPGGPLSSAVNPIYAGNPNYDLGDLVGANTVGLNVSQLPSHTHTATSSASSAVTDPGHTHYAGHTPDQWGGSGTIGITTNSPQNVLTTSSYTNITVATTVNVSNGNTGSGENHANIQPVIAAYYIMYIP